MKPITHRPIVAAVAALFSVIPASVQADPAGYTLTNLGTLPGGSSSHAHAINDKGQVVGDSRVRVPGTAGDSQDVMVWDATNGMKDLGHLPGGDTTSAYGINNQGDIVGWGLCQGRETGFYMPAGKTAQIVTAPGGGMCYLFGVNDKHQAIGYGNLDDGIPAEAFRWHDGSFTGCGRLGEQDSWPNGINANGDIVGKSRASSDGNDHPFLWTSNHGMKDLGLLPGATSGEATAINDSDTVVGYCDGKNGRVPFIWTAATGMKPLSADPHAAGEPAAINSAGIVVGKGSSGAVMWVDGMQVNLNRLLPPGRGFKLTEATGINNKGQIVGTGGEGNPVMTGAWRAWLLTPIGP